MRNSNCPSRFWPALAVPLLALGLFAGCEDKPPVANEKAKPLLQGVKLRLTVADDAAMVAEIRRLVDEWAAQTGADLTVAETTAKDLEAANSLEADAVICPAWMLGPLAEAGRLAEMPRELHRERLADVPQDRQPGDSGAWAKTFPLLRLREAVWGSRTYAVPCGSPVLCLYYRADLLEKLGRKPPQTWAEYDELAGLLQKSESKSGMAGALEPLGRGWAGLTLIARAAAYAKHPDSYSVLFDIESMEPLIDGPPFVRALEELVATAKHGPAEQLGDDPTTVRAAFWQEKCGMALTWPTAARQAIPFAASEGARVGFAPLPGAGKVYNLATKKWEARPAGEQNRVPVFDISGRIGVVSKGSGSSDAAFQLLLWLSESSTAGRVCPASSSTTLFKRTHVPLASVWAEKPVSLAAAADYAAMTATTLGAPQSIPALRISGRAEYLAALDEAVWAAVKGEKPAAAALKAVAERWWDINKRRGIDAQKRAYRHDLGLD